MRRATSTAWFFPSTAGVSPSEASRRPSGRSRWWRLVAGIGRVVDELDLPQPLPPVSLIGVDYLFEPDVLVELEAFAVLE
ncbi:hypothetical protein [Plantibacter sp. YIM 135249]|uniref:hypothetical protein n=1 Tax=Plantibacter sp. YIM 135249 TaxID=3423918 RepID=UPI003D356DA3